MNTILLRRAVARGIGWRAFAARDGRLLFCVGLWDDERAPGRRSSSRWEIVEIRPHLTPSVPRGTRTDDPAYWLTHDR